MQETFRQIWTLTLKNLLIVLVKSPILTPFRALVLPVAFSIFIVFAQTFFVPPNRYGINNPYDVRSFPKALQDSASFRNRISFSNSGLTGGGIDQVISNLTHQARGVGYEVKNNLDNNGVTDFCQPTQRGTSSCFAIVTLTDSPTDTGKDWSYEVIADAALGKSVNMHSNHNDAEVYIMPLQHALDMKISDLQSPQRTIPKTVRELGYTTESEANRLEDVRVHYVNIVISAVGVAFLVAIIPVMYQLTGLIATEREIGMTQLIDCMLPGTSQTRAQFIRIMSAYFALSIIYLPSWIITAVMIQTKLYTKTSFAINLFACLLGAGAISSFAIFIGAFFSRAQLSGIFSVIFSLVLGIAAQLVQFKDPITVGVLGGIFPPMNFVFFIISAARFEVTRQPVNLSEHIPNGSWSLPMYAFLCISGGQILIYPVLAGIVERALFGTKSSDRSQKRTENPLNPAVSLIGFSKIFASNWLVRLFRPKRQKVLAVDNLNLDVMKGEIMVLLGANGSGKSTTLDAISGLSKSSAGRIRIDYSMGSGGFGLCPQQNVLWDQLTVEEHIWIFDRLKSRKIDYDKQKVQNLIDACDLTKKAKARSQTLSGGQKRKLQLAMMFTGGSTVCAVDEVSSGVDPISRRKIWDILLAERGRRSILLTTHFLDEADLLADHIAIMSKGVLKVYGTSVELKHYFGSGYRVHIYRVPGSEIDYLPRIPGIPMEVTFDHVVYLCPSSPDVIEVVTFLEYRSIREYRVSGPTIEDVFLKVARDSLAPELQVDQDRRHTTIQQPNLTPPDQLGADEATDNHANQSTALLPFSEREGYPLNTQQLQSRSAPVSPFNQPNDPLSPQPVSAPVSPRRGRLQSPSHLNPANHTQVASRSVVVPRSHSEPAHIDPIVRNHPAWGTRTQTEAFAPNNVSAQPLPEDQPAQFLSDTIQGDVSDKRLSSPHAFSDSTKQEPSDTSESVDIQDTFSPPQLFDGRRISILRQLVVLFEKRLVILRRSSLAYLLALAIPIIAAGCVTLYLQNYQPMSCGGSNHKRAAEHPSAVLGPSPNGNISSMPEYKTFIGRNSNLKPWANSNNVEGVSSYNDFQDYIKANYSDLTTGGIYLGDTTHPPAFAWRGDGGQGGMYYAAGVQNAMDSIITNLTINYKYNVMNVPQSSISGDALQFAAYFELAMVCYPALLALYPTVERLRGIRAMHYSNGVRSLPLWLAYISFDFVIALVSSIVVTIIFRVMSNVFYGLGYLFVVLVLYGFTSILLAYVVSMFATSQLATFAIAAGSQAVLWVAYLIAYLCIITFGQPNSIDSNLTLMHFVFAVFSPIINLTRGLFVGLNMFSVICQHDKLISYPGSILAYGGPILYLILQGMFLFCVLIYWESDFTVVSLFRRASRASDVEEEIDGDEKFPEVEPLSQDDSNGGLRVIHLKKRFRRHLAVEDVTFSVPRGEVFALLGPNGAGKSTTISLIRGEMRPTSRKSDILINNLSVITQREAARANLGTCPQFDAMDQMTVNEQLRFYAKVRGVSDVDHNVSEVMRAVGLCPFRDRLASRLSGGNRRKLSLGVALMGNPSVLLLDEPSSGMDAASKRVMWRTLASVVPNRSLVLTTHSMEEADALADRAGIMARRMLDIGTTDLLRRKYGNVYYVHVVHKDAPRTPHEVMMGIREWALDTFPESVAEERFYQGQLRFTVPAELDKRRLTLMSEGKRSSRHSSSSSLHQHSVSQQLQQLQQQQQQQQQQPQQLAVPDGSCISTATTAVASSPLTPHPTISTVLSILEQNKPYLGLEYYSVSQTSLDQVFLEIVGKHYDEDGP